MVRSSVEQEDQAWLSLSWHEYSSVRLMTVCTVNRVGGLELEHNCGSGILEVGIGWEGPSTED